MYKIVSMLVILWLPLIGHSTVITFDGLEPGPYLGHTQEGFTITPLGNLKVQTGNFPIEYSILRALDSSLDVIDLHIMGDSNFFFNSVDLGVTETTIYFMHGFLNGEGVYSLVDRFECSQFGFCGPETVINPYANVEVDAVSFGFFVYDPVYRTIDNIVLQPLAKSVVAVSEPSTVYLFVLGAMYLVYRARRLGVVNR